MRNKTKKSLVAGALALLMVGSLLPDQVLAGMESRILGKSETVAEKTSQSIPLIDEEWSQLIGGSGDEVFTSVIETTDGGFLAVGHSSSSASGKIEAKGFGEMDGLMVKFNAKGVKVWDRLIGGSNDDFLNSVTEMAGGSFIAAGYSESSKSGNLSDLNNGGQDGLLVKVDSKGNILWNQLFGGKGMDRFYSMIQTSDGNLLVAGESNSSKSGDITRVSNGSSDGLLVQFDPFGQKVWHQLLGGSGLDFFSDVIETSDGFVAVGGSYSKVSGHSQDKNNGSQDGLIVKVNAKGVPQWDQVFGGRAYDRFDAVVETANQGFIVAGSSSSTKSGELKDKTKGGKDGLLVSFDSLGKSQWSKLIGGVGQDGFSSLMKTKTGFLAAGSLDAQSLGSDSSGRSKQAIGKSVLYEFNESGTKLWDQIQSDGKLTHYQDLKATKDGGFLAVGAAQNETKDGSGESNAESTDGLITKYYVPKAPAITAQPKNQVLTAGQVASFSASASGSLAPSVQWQVKEAGSSNWQNIDGQKSKTLKVTTKLADDGNSYRAVFTNKWGSVSSQAASLAVSPVQSLDVISGSNRFLTAAAISQATYQRADTAILVQSDYFPDALAASSLAYAMNAPILLTETERLHEATKNELSRLGVKKIVILGGVQAIDQRVDVSLKNLGITAERIAGSTRYHTATLVAERLKTIKGTPKTAIITSGVSFADALSVGSDAAQKGYPVLLTDGNYLSLANRNFLKANEIKQVDIMGGSLVVSSGVEQQLKEAGITVNRIGGATRVDTSAKMAKQAFPNADHAIVANGWSFPDALAAAPYAAKLNAPILLVSKDSVSDPIKDYLKDSTINTIKVIGGNLVVEESTRKELLEAIIK